MSLIEILILLLVIIGIVGAGWILIGVLIFFYGWFENIRIRKKIPDKIKKEVEDARLKRKSKQEDARRRYANDETSTGEPAVAEPHSKIPDNRDTSEPESIQRMDDDRDVEIERSSKPDRRRFKFNPV